MSVYVFYGDITASWFVAQYDAWQNILNIKEQQRFLDMKSVVKKQQLVMSRYLIHQGLNKLGYSSNNNYEIINYNQLRLSDIKHSFSLSITHSGNIAAIVLSEQPLKLGIDVELSKVRNFTELAQEFCTPEEVSLLASSANIQESFYQLWTTKEALTKAGQLSLLDCYRCNCVDVLHNESGVLLWQGERYFFHRLKWENTLGIVLCHNKAVALTNIIQCHG